MPICKLTTHRGCIRNVCQFWLCKENFSFGLRFWHVDDRMYVHLFVGPDGFIDFWVIFWKIFHFSKSPNSTHISKLVTTELYSQDLPSSFSSLMFYEVKVNSNCFQRCFFYRKRYSQWNFKNRSTMFFWNLTLISTYGSKNINLHGIFLSPK